ncbi:glycolate oxidase subunit GlcE [Paraburkholderia rhizosphaerae]|uniref:Glycolate oxidase FAD binding subunit n=1 Tax=Paraburkholderia rhizosphaerae TaxID=480658 RepID=A0A4R8LJI3_9BURK|nr:glycolate oxidase subunit GlcE [Paraburkholderia rhizosphaerae]TDY42435.1 glycolate oxidase FAD binding subunit [Paraburkholderia rhizosphaerae]
MRRDFESVDDSIRLIDQVASAAARRVPLRIRGGDSKVSLGRPVEGEALDTRGHRGVVSYDPTELVITVRAGTPVAELNAVLDDAGQMLPCEPPEFAGQATVGGAVASGLSGPRRPWVGAVRDFVLGCRLITSEGKYVRFGGEVMKNVAGYDLSRLMAGSFGCLGVIAEVSFKVLPKPRAQYSLCHAMSAAEALDRIVEWRRAGLPVTGACHLNDALYLRLEGGTASVQSAAQRIGGTGIDPSFWTDLREQRLRFFSDPACLWRLSLPNGANLAAVPGEAALDWGGAQRWLKSNAPAAQIRHLAESAGGHATCFTPAAGVEPFHPLPAPLLRFHKQLKQKLDPHGILNPGRMYAEL